MPNAYPSTPLCRCVSAFCPSSADNPHLYINTDVLNFLPYTLPLFLPGAVHADVPSRIPWFVPPRWTTMPLFPAGEHRLPRYHLLFGHTLPPFVRFAFFLVLILNVRSPTWAF